MNTVSASQPSLTEYVKTHRQDDEFVTHFQQAGQHILGETLAAVQQGDRSAELQAIDKLNDLRAATLQTMLSTRDGQQENQAAIKDEIAAANHGGSRWNLRRDTVTVSVPTFKHVWTDTTLDGKKYYTHKNVFGQLPNFDRERRGPETAVLAVGESKPMSDVKHFAQDVQELTTYLTAMTISGQVGQQVEVSTDARAGGSSQGESSGRVVGGFETALSVGSGGIGGSETSSSSSHYSASSQAVALRVTALLLDLQTRLAGARLAAGTQSQVVAHYPVTMSKGDGKPVVFWEEPYSNGAYTTEMLAARELEKVPNQPKHLGIPTSSLQPFDDKFFSGAARFDTESLAPRS